MIEESQSKSGEIYDSLVSDYTAVMTNVHNVKYEEPKFWEALGDVTGKDVLDLACGSGHFTRGIKEKGANNIVGVDISEQMILEARKIERDAPLGIDYCVSDASSYIFKSDSLFDLGKLQYKLLGPIVDCREGWRAQVGKRSAGTDSGKRRGEWESRMFTLPLHSSHQDKDELYQMEYGEARLDSPSSGAPAIMAVHSSGSSYKQWSGLKEYISTGSCSGLYGINLFGYGRSEARRREIRPSATEDLVALLETATEHVETATEHVETATEHVEMATEHVDPRRRWHLIGHSGGGGAVLAAAASGGPLVDKLDAVHSFTAADLMVEHILPKERKISWMVNQQLQALGGTFAEIKENNKCFCRIKQF